MDLLINIDETGGSITAFDGEEPVDTVYSFENHEDVFCGHRIWDTDRLQKEVKAGIAQAFLKYPETARIRLSAWKYDYVLMCDDRELLPCYSHHDDRIREICDSDHVNNDGTVVQLMVDLRHGRLRTVTDILMMPEYFLYKLTGERAKKGEKPVRGALKAGSFGNSRRCEIFINPCS